MDATAKALKRAAMDDAAVKALAEFDTMWDQLQTGPERYGAKSVIKWLKAHYCSAGYKRLLSRGIFKKELR